MVKKFRDIVILASLILGIVVLGVGCRTEPTPTIDVSAEEGSETEVIEVDLPEITGVHLDRTDVPRYESLEFVLDVKADYDNPYDVREVSLDGILTAPDGAEWVVPGFWDGKEAWKLRFTPSQEGKWHYQVSIKDLNGLSVPVEGTFNVVASKLHGWLQVGSWFNPDYSSHYLIHHDGTPFYGIGHCDALNILIDGFSVDEGVGLFNNMVAAGENYVVWWPVYSNSPINSSYADYTVSNLDLIDLVVKDAQEKGVFLIFTIWDHPQLRDQTHSWGDGRWDGYNGFSKLSDIDAFFTDDDPWIWQQNYYRYIIARWGYSLAIGMWQTVSEINGTNAYDQTDPWHEKVNAYFVQHDPYRHPTTASKSGDVDWPEGYQVMDVPQVHVYSMDNEPVKDVVKASETIADWTQLMWQTGKPNWIGEFGVQGNNYYPELFHNSIWAALGAGAALTPAEWNSGGSWMQMTEAMYADMMRLAHFVADIPLVQLNPSALEISSNQLDVRAWGVAGEAGGLFWVQDFALQGNTIDNVRSDQSYRTGIQVEIDGPLNGVYLVTPYDTWQGTFLDTFEVDCNSGQMCALTLPEFQADMAFKLERK